VCVYTRGERESKGGWRAIQTKEKKLKFTHGFKKTKKQTHDRKRGVRDGEMYTILNLLNRKQLTPIPSFFFIVSVCWRNRNSRLEFPIRRESSKFLRLISEKMSALFFDFSFRIPLGTEIPGRIPSEMLSAHDSLYSVLFRQHIIDPLGAQSIKRWTINGIFFRLLGKYVKMCLTSLTSKLYYFFPPGDFLSLIFLQNNVPMMCTPGRRK
jgi:hypothetical protein